MSDKDALVNHLIQFTLARVHQLYTLSSRDLFGNILGDFTDQIALANADKECQTGEQKGQRRGCKKG